MKITNWNGQPKVVNANVNHYPKLPGTASFCPRGMGRSYGDASLAASIVDMCPERTVFALEEGVLEVSAGFTIEEVLNRLVPQGFSLPVLPGTRHVTLGGMIAADVHGKNHVQNGSIGSWVEALHLRLPDGREVHCSPTEERELFRASIGGLGLTGLILSIRLRVEQIVGTRWKQHAHSFENLNELIKALTHSSAAFKTGWFDALSMKHFYLLENEVIPSVEHNEFRLKPVRLRIPRLPFSLIHRPSMRLYNLRYSKRLARNPQRVIDWEECFFPLDRIAQWNHLYGPRGFFQLQCVVPQAVAAEVYTAMVEKMRRANRLPVLCVAKMHGDHQPLPGLLSYTHPGISIAFDFCNTPGTAEFIRSLHRDIAEVGGRVYLVKDALLEQAEFERMYPEAEEFRAILKSINQGQIKSLLAKRLNLVP